MELQVLPERPWSFLLSPFHILLLPYFHPWLLKGPLKELHINAPKTLAEKRAARTRGKTQSRTRRCAVWRAGQADQAVHVHGSLLEV